MGEGDRRGSGAPYCNRLADARVPVDVIRVPMALGADREGVDRGARELDEALRQRLRSRGFPEILGRLHDSLEITVAPLGHTVRQPGRYPHALHVDAIAAASRELSSAVSAAVLAGHFPLVLGGDHALSIGSIGGAALSRTLGVIWIDAHADINSPETSPSGHVHGMPLAAAIGRGPQPLVDVAAGGRLALKNLVYIGVRDLDPGERDLLRDSDALVYTMDRVDALGLLAVAHGAIEHLLSNSVEAVHLSFDLDSLDPTILPGTGTRVPGGFTYREARQLLTLLRESDLPIISADVVELNPLLDSTNGSTEIAAGLTAALLGESQL
jgi:arginase